jgi:hypothetical protein
MDYINKNNHIYKKGQGSPFGLKDIEIIWAPHSFSTTFKGCFGNYYVNTICVWFLGVTSKEFWLNFLNVVCIFLLFHDLSLGFMTKVEVN